MTQATIDKITIGTHNALLTSFPGGDGIKTGYTCASGYNLVASATRDGRKLIAIILGESSSNARTARAAALLENGFRTRDWKIGFPHCPRRELSERNRRRRLRAQRAACWRTFNDCKAPPPPPPQDGRASAAPARPRQARRASGREEGVGDQIDGKKTVKEEKARADRLT